MANGGRRFRNIEGNVLRPIVGFAVDGEGEPIAILSCGHPQHVRHRPPFVNRPWVMTEEGRRGKLGASLNCVRCERFELPTSFAPYETSAVFDAGSLPLELEKGHATEAGVWARIVVLEGRLRYVVPALGADVELSERCAGIVVPEVPYRVAPIGSVRFFVERYGRPDRAE